MTITGERDISHLKCVRHNNCHNHHHNHHIVINVEECVVGRSFISCRSTHILHNINQNPSLPSKLQSTLTLHNPHKKHK